jgi:hypothetical protein
MLTTRREDRCVPASVEAQRGGIHMPHRKQLKVRSEKTQTHAVLERHPNAAALYARWWGETQAARVGRAGPTGSAACSVRSPAFRNWMMPLIIGRSSTAACHVCVGRCRTSCANRFSLSHKTSPSRRSPSWGTWIRCAASPQEFYGFWPEQLVRPRPTNDFMLMLDPALGWRLVCGGRL